jgi:hypothetical protein
LYRSNNKSQSDLKECKLKFNCTADCIGVGPLDIELDEKKLGDDIGAGGNAFAFGVEFGRYIFFF